jgi:DNA primase
MTKEEIKQNTSMFDVIGRYGFQVNRSSMILCPFHQEKTPSCSIKRDFFKCFGCGAAGDQFKFVMLMENCDFKEAFQELGGTNERMTDAVVSRISTSRKKIETKRNIKSLFTSEYIEKCEQLRRYEETIEQFKEEASKAQDFTEMEPELLEKYADAVKHVDSLKYEIEILSDQLYRMDKEGATS